MTSTVVHVDETLKECDPDNFLNFPPFYTLQPVETTRKNQLQIWRNVIVKYVHLKNLKGISLNEFQLFENHQIGRKLDSEARTAIAQNLIDSGHGEWNDINHNSMTITWRTAGDWGQVMYQHANELELVDTVYTLYELHSGDISRGTEFHGLDASTCFKALESLAHSGKVQIFAGAETLDETGFKFIRK